MSETVDLRSSLRVLRRRSRWFFGALLTGALLGGAYGYLSPPALRSTALVLLPPSATTANGSPSRLITTEIRIATSTTVQAAAGRAVTPHLTEDDVAKRISVSGPTDDILQFQSHGSNAKAAEQLANAAAQAYIAYSVGSTQDQSGALLPQLKSRASTLNEQIRNLQDEVDRTSKRLASETKGSAAANRDSALLGSLRAEQSDTALLLDQVNASIRALTNPTSSATSTSTTGNTNTAAATLLQPANTATRSSQVVWMVECALLGGFAMAFLTSIVLIAIDRRDRRPRTRDEIATAVGAPVLGSMPARAQRDASGWTDLLVTYRPEAVEEWSLRKTLRQLGVADARAERGTSILILALDEDLAGLALAPQLAVAAAASGVNTTLVPLNGLPSSASFRAACGRLAGTNTREHLRVEATLEDELLRQRGDFVVFVAVVSWADPRLAELPRAATTILSLASGRATADQLARIAVAADDAGRPLDGILVADPPADDVSSGRFPAPGLIRATTLPTRVTGTATSGGRL